LLGAANLGLRFEHQQTKLEIKQMTQAKHTPGPWLQMGSSVGVTHGEIASVWEIDGRSFSNARLIAAAPDLLEALDLLLNDVGRGNSMLGAIKARAAIAKATGA
jgi:hypothetical protein